MPPSSGRQHILPCWPPAGPAGTFIVARMLWRSLSWMGWVGLAAVLAPFPELGAGLGLVAEAAAGAEGAGVARVEEVVDDGVTAADWLRELRRQRAPLERTRPHTAGPTRRVQGARPGFPAVPPITPWRPHGGAGAMGLTWRRSCSLEARCSPVSWPGRVQSGPPAHLRGARKCELLCPLAHQEEPAPPQARGAGIPNIRARSRRVKRGGGATGPEEPQG